MDTGSDSSAEGADPLRSNVDAAEVDAPAPAPACPDGNG